MTVLTLEVRQAFRLLFSRKTFSVTAIGTIAVAIAAQTLMFALIRGILLRPLPLHEPSRLVRIEESHRTGVTNLTGATFADVHAQSRTFEALTAFRVGPASVSHEGMAIQASAATVTVDYFTVLGVGALQGRLFDRADALSGSAPVVILSRSVWQRLFGSDPSAVGRIVLVNAAPRQIVGIVDVPSSSPGASDVWLPYPDDAPLLLNRRAHLFTVVGRLGANATLASANAELAAIGAGIRDRDEGGSNLSLRATLLSDRMVQSIRPTLIVLWASVCVLLVIAFANVANLLLVQGSVRALELSIRTALGAGRLRLVRQLVIESIVLGAIGGGAGAMLGALGIPVLQSVLPPTLTRLSEVSADPLVVGCGVVLSILCSVVFGLLAALRTSVRNPMDALRSRDADGGRSRVRDALVAAELALTLVLLVGTMLLGRSLLSVSRVEMGFDPVGVATVDLSLPSARYDGAAAHWRFYDAALQRIAALPNVESAGVTGALPLSPTAATTMVPQDGREDTAHSADVIAATPGVFPALRIALSRGRLFTSIDRAGAPPVAIVNEATARQFWPAGIDPIGRSITMQDWGDPYRATIIGIVRDVHQAGPDQPVSPAIYYPLAQFPETTRTQTIVVRGGSPETSIGSIREIVRTLDRDQPVALASTMEARTRGVTAQRRVNLLLFGAFTIAALVMAAVGIYGVVSFAMAARTREIGVRIALGADAQQIASLALFSGAVPVIAGVVTGVAAALIASRALADLLYGVTAHDPVAFGCAVVGVLVVALAAVGAPTRRAVQVDPIVALRAE